MVDVWQHLAHCKDISFSERLNILNFFDPQFTQIGQLLDLTFFTPYCIFTQSDYTFACSTTMIIIIYEIKRAEGVSSILMVRKGYTFNNESWVMRTVPIGSVDGIVFARVLLGMSEIAQPALAIPPMVPTKSCGARTICSRIRVKPFELAPPGLANTPLKLICFI